ncbi:MAG: RNA polymerase sigma factor [Janthinobacterium lividum]
MSGRAAVLRQMDVEWSALQQDEQAGATCRRWGAGSRPLTGCTRPAEVLGRVATAPDVVLGHLLAESAAGERLAGRVVLQALLPKVVRMAAVDPAAGVDEYVTAMWCEIASYPLARRPVSVAANLALDTLKAVRRERHPAADVATPPHLVVLAADRRPGQVVGSPSRSAGRLDVLEVLAQARHHRLVDPATGDLLHSVYAEGLSGESAARRHGLSPGAVRTRCSRAVKVLAEHAVLLAPR